MLKVRVPISPKIWYNPSLCKEDWGEGDWVTEPDKAQMATSEGYPCLLLRHPYSGHWCYYVGVPENHPMYGKDLYTAMDVLNADVTYADRERLGDPFEQSISFEFSRDNPPKYWLLGGDMAHYGDLCPGINSLHRAVGLPEQTRSTYKSFGYTIRAANILAQELHKMGLFWEKYSIRGSKPCPKF